MNHDQGVGKDMEGYDPVLFQGGGNRGSLSHGLFSLRLPDVSGCKHLQHIVVLPVCTRHHS